MATVFVTQAGAGSADGTDLDNARAMSWLNANVSAGNTYLLSGAITTTINPGASGTSGSPIVIKAEPTTGATLTATGSASAVNINARSYVEIRNFTIDVTGSTGNGVLIQSGAANNVIAGNTISAGSGSPIAFNGASVSAYEDNTITGNTLIGGLTGIRFLGTVNALNHTGFYIVGNTIYGQTNEGVRLTVESATTTATINDTTVSRNTIHDTGWQSISIRAVYAATDDDTPPALWGVGCRVDGNSIRECGTADTESGSIHVLGVEGFTISGNTVRNCYTKGALIQGQRRKNGDIARNVLSGATPASSIDGNGVFADRFDDNVRIVGNEISDCPGLDGVNNSGAGIGMWMCTNIEVYSNVVRNCRLGANVGGNAVQAVTGSAMHNNTFADCEVAGYQGDFDGTGMASDALELQNNAFVRCAVGIEARGTELDVCDYNAFEGCPTLYVDQTAGANDVTEPLLLSEGLAPLPGSPLLTQGADLGYRRDIRGVKGRAYIGAYAPPLSRPQASNRPAASAREASA